MVEIDTPFHIQTKPAKKTYLIAYIRDHPLPLGAKNALQIMILAACASETNKSTAYWSSRVTRLKNVTCYATDLCLVGQNNILVEILAKEAFGWMNIDEIL